MLARSTTTISRLILAAYLLKSRFKKLRFTSVMLREKQVQNTLIAIFLFKLADFL
jgi:hypothetical protein